MNKTEAMREKLGTKALREIMSKVDEAAKTDPYAAAPKASNYNWLHDKFLEALDTIDEQAARIEELAAENEMHQMMVHDVCPENIPLIKAKAAEIERLKEELTQWQQDATDHVMDNS